MRKTFLLFTLMLLTASSLTAQNLYGKWKTETVDENGLVVTILFNFSDESHLRMDMKTSMHTAEIGTVKLSVTTTASYTRTKKELNVKFSPSSIKMNIDDIKYNDEIATVLRDQPELAAGIKRQLVGVLEANKAELIKQLPFGQETTFSILSLTATELKLSDASGDITTFTRVGQ